MWGGSSVVDDDGGWRADEVGLVVDGGVVLGRPRGPGALSGIGSDSEDVMPFDGWEMLEPLLNVAVEGSGLVVGGESAGMVGSGGSFSVYMSSKSSDNPTMAVG